MMFQMDSFALPGMTAFELGAISSSMTWHWNLTISAPAAAASSIMRIAFPTSPSWLIPISAITSGGWAGPTRRPAITISFMRASIRARARPGRLLLNHQTLLLPSICHTSSTIRSPGGCKILQDFSYSCRDHVVCRGRVVPVPRDEELVAVDAVFSGETRENVDHCDSMRLRDLLDALVIGAPRMMPRYLVAAG